MQEQYTSTLRVLEEANIVQSSTVWWQYNYMLKPTDLFYPNLYTSEELGHEEIMLPVYYYSYYEKMNNEFVSGATELEDTVTVYIHELAASLSYWLPFSFILIAVRNLILNCLGGPSWRAAKGAYHAFVLLSNIIVI